MIHGREIFNCYASMKKIFLFFTLLFISFTAMSQTVEHWVGCSVGNVIGSTYIYHYNRWNVVAAAGLLTGFEGGHASVGGLYDINLGKFGECLYSAYFSVGLGLFAQNYYNPSAKQEQWAKDMGYLSPYGVHTMIEFHSPISSRWGFVVRNRIPIYFTNIEDKHSTYLGSLLSFTQFMFIYKLF
jgi:hypothetical protein